jgi:hypothetical protein
MFARGVGWVINGFLSGGGHINDGHGDVFEMARRQASSNGCGLVKLDSLNDTVDF